MPQVWVLPLHHPCPHSLCRDTLPLLCPASPTCKPTVPGRQQALDHHVLTSVTLCTDQPAGLQRRGPPPGDLAGGHVFSSLVRSSGEEPAIPSYTTSPTQPRSQSILAYLEHPAQPLPSFRQSCGVQPSEIPAPTLPVLGPWESHVLEVDGRQRVLQPLEPSAVKKSQG